MFSQQKEEIDENEKASSRMEDSQGISIGFLN